MINDYIRWCFSTNDGALLSEHFPKVAPVDFQDSTILVIWIPAGPARPYEAPETLAKGAPYYSYIRRFASTVKANTDGQIEEVKDKIG